MDVFKYRNYRPLIQDWINSSQERGARRRIASAARCSPSWITRVLNEDANLTTDQAFGVAQLFEFNDPECDYFLLLIEQERTGSPAFRKRIENRMHQLRKDSLTLHKSIVTRTGLSKEGSKVYFSSWSCPAIHIACMVRPHAQEELASRLNMPQRSVASTLKQLQTLGLVENRGGMWTARTADFHLPASSELGNQAHRNLRLRICQYLEDPHFEGLHYSAIHCLSKSDVEEIHKKLKEALLKCRKTIELSRPETLGVLCLDWFEM